jgi:hypothetical protein
LNGEIKTVRCHYEKLSDYINQVGYENILNILSCYGGCGEYFYTLVYKNEIELKDC